MLPNGLTNQSYGRGSPELLSRVEQGHSKPEAPDSGASLTVGWLVRKASSNSKPSSTHVTHPTPPGGSPAIAYFFSYGVTAHKRDLVSSRETDG